MLPALSKNRVNCGADVDQSGIEKGQACGLGAAEKERQLGAGEDDRFESFFVAQALGPGKTRRRFETERWRGGPARLLGPDRRSFARNAAE